MANFRGYTVIQMEQGAEEAENLLTYILYKGLSKYEKSELRNAFIKITRNTLEEMFTKHHVIVKKATDRHDEGVGTYYMNKTYFSNLICEDAPIEILIFETGEYVFGKCSDQKYFRCIRCFQPVKEGKIKKVIFTKRQNVFVYTDEEQKRIDDGVKKLKFPLWKAT